MGAALSSCTSPPRGGHRGDLASAHEPGPDATVSVSAAVGVAGRGDEGDEEEETETEVEEEETEKEEAEVVKEAEDEDAPTSPLLGALLEDLREVFEKEVLKERLDPTDLAVLAQVGRACLAAVVSSGLPRAGKSEGVPLMLKDFLGSVERLAWAKQNMCPWNTRTCARVARRGHGEPD